MLIGTKSPEQRATSVEQTGGRCCYLAGGNPVHPCFGPRGCFFTILVD
jgi:hypothetical protein